MDIPREAYWIINVYGIERKEGPITGRMAVVKVLLKRLAWSRAELPKVNGMA